MCHRSCFTSFHAQDELIGVGFLYLDGLQFLLDINHRVPLVSYAGYDAGSVQLRVRAWIDKVEVKYVHTTCCHNCDGNACRFCQHISRQIGKVI